MLDRLLVPTGHAPGLSDRPTADKLGLGDKQEAAQTLISLQAKLFDLQRRLWAESSRAFLVVLQAMDAAGKDGTIRHVFSGVNPQGVRVTSFKAPTERERSQDYLWRVHANAPAHGEIGIFNRSHYEDVLAVRVRELVPAKAWRRRYRHIREFERLLVEEGTAVVKIHLHISSDEQRKRLQARLDDPAKRWKFRVGDLDDRKLWDAYRDAYEDAITETNTRDAPWYVVPADRKWVRNVAVSEILVHTLEDMAPRYPSSQENLDGVTVV
jgi:PPK2 family polyphosphate:nucleotide phosphotransferase